MTQQQRVSKMMTHLNVIRRLSIEFLLLWMGMFMLIYVKHETILTFILKIIGKTKPVMATQILSPLLIPLEISIDLSLFLCIPFGLLQIWRFVAPGLLAQEKMVFRGILLFSLMLFGMGLVFCWFWILPFLFSLLGHALPQEIIWMPSWQSFYEFILMIEGFFGVSFQIPLAMFVLVWSRVLSYQQIKATRPYAIVIAFIIGMLVTPPDVTSQILVAIPLCLLYELGILLSYFAQKK